MTNKVVESGVGGRLTTHGWPSQDGDVHCLDPRKDSHIDAIHNGALFQTGHSDEAQFGARTSEVDYTADDCNDVANQDDAVVAGSNIGPLADYSVSS